MKEERKLFAGLLVAILFLAAAIWLAVSTGWLSGSTSVMWGGLSQGWEVVAGGRSYGVIADRAAVEQAVAQIVDEHGADGTDLKYIPVMAPPATFTDETALCALLSSRAKAGVDAALILVGGQPAAAVPSLEEGWRAVEAALEPWREHPLLENAEPLERVRVVSAVVEEGRVLDVRGAANALILGEAAPRSAKVRAGDSLSGFAARHGLTVGELLRANPRLIGRTELTASAALIVTRPLGLLHVRCESLGSAAIMPEPVYRADTGLYVTQRRVIEEGSAPGGSEIREIWIDGVCVSVSGEEAPDAQPAVIAYGTRPLPSSGEAVAVGAGGVLWPVRGTVSSGFGWRWGRMHQGVDIAAALATPVLAARAGTVVYAGWRGDYGQLVEIDHGGGLVTRYGHCYGMLVKEGDKVAAGDVLSLLGSTGRSTGPHLHFEVRVDGTPVDPMKRLGT